MAFTSRQMAGRPSSTWALGIRRQLPAGRLGRIGLAVSRSKPNIVYAQMEVGPSQGTGGEEPLVGGGQPGASPTPSPSPSASPAASPTPAPLDPKKSGVWRSDDKG